MTLNPLLVKSYRHEYETTDITEDQLKSKHSLPADFDMSSWTKDTAEPEPKKELIIPEVLPPETPTATETAPPPEEPDEVDDHKKKISEFKGLALDHALSFMKNDIEYAEVKEFKDMVSVVDSIEKSTQKPGLGNGTTVNILVQNIMNEFTDDC